MGLGTAKKINSIYRIAGAGRSLEELNYAPDTWPTIFWRSNLEEKKNRRQPNRQSARTALMCRAVRENPRLLRGDVVPQLPGQIQGSV